MFDNRLLTNELAAIACPKRGKLEYELPTALHALQWSVTFRLLGVYRWELDGGVRCVHQIASSFARRCLRELAGNWWANTLARNPGMGNGMGFPIANLAPWSSMHSLRIKDFTAQECASRVAKDVESYVLPFVASVQSEQRYLELLLADEKPMQWLFCQPLTRFAEVVWLSAKLGKNEVAAMAALKRERKFAQGQLQGVELDEYAERVVQAARADA